MKTFLGLVLVGLVASVSCLPPIKLVPGQSYIYSYSGRLISGIAQFDSSAALLEMKCDIVFQEEQSSHIAMQMMNIRVGKQNGPVVQQLYGHSLLDHQPEQRYEEELSKPIRFFWDNGQIKNFEADRNESQWSINIKKSILGVLSVNLAPKLTTNDINKRNDLSATQSANDNQLDDKETVVYPVYEDGINGVCETLYQIISAAPISSSSPSVQVFNITKTRNYRNCLRQSNIDHSSNDIRGAPVICHQGKSYPLIQSMNNIQSSNYKLGGCEQKSDDQSDSPVGLFNYVKYNITSSQSTDSSQIDSIFGQGKTVHQIKGKQMVLISEQNLTLAEVVPTSKIGPIQQIRNIMLHQDLSYRLPENVDNLEIPYFQLYGQIDKQELQELIPSLLESVASDIEASQVEPSKNTMQKIVQLVNAVAVVDETHLQNVFDRIAQQGVAHRATNYKTMVRKLFIDLIGHAGTTTATLFAKRLFEQDRITTNEAKEIFETVPQNLYRIDAKVVQAYLDMLLSDKVQNERHLASSMGIALGKLIQQATNRQYNSQYADDSEKSFMRGIQRTGPWLEDQSVRAWDEQQVSQVLQLLREALKKSNTFQQKVTLIETLAHAGTQEALSYLAPYVKNEVSAEELPGYPVENEEDVDQERNFIRQVTIYALTHIAKQSENNRAQVLSLLLPIFKNKFEPYEVRIASFTVLLTCNPDKVILEQIGSEMHEESNRQVKSFVVSALNTVANFSDPSSRKLADDARFALGFAPKDYLGLQYSKMFGENYYDNEKKYGLNVMVEWVANNISQIPRSGYFAVRENDGPTQNVLIEVGYNAKGVDSIIKRMVKSNTLISNLLQSTNTFGEDRNVLKRGNADSMKDTIKSMIKDRLDINVRQEEEFKATVFLNMFDRASYYSFDREYVEKLIDSVEDSVKEMTNELVQGQEYHYVRLAMPKQMQKVVYSEIGLPVIVTERHPTIISLKINQAKLQLNKNEKSALPDAANLTVQVEPSIYHTTYNFVFALLPVTTEAIGTHVERSSRVVIPFDFSVGYWRTSQKINWSVQPRIGQEILHHQTQAKTFIVPAIIAGSAEREWLSGARTIRSQSVPYQYEREYLKKIFGVGMRLQVSTENGYFDQPWYQSRTAQKYGLLAAYFELINNHHLTPCMVHLTLESDEQNPVTGYDMSLRYKKVHVNDQQNDSDDADDDDHQSLSQYDNSQQGYGNYRRRQHESGQKKLSKNIKNGRSSVEIKNIVRELVNEWNQVSDEYKTDEQTDMVAHSIEIIGESQGAQSTVYGLEFLLAHTYDQRMYYTNVQGVSQEPSSSTVNRQLCVDSVMANPKAPSDFYYDEIAVQNLKAKIQTKIDFGNDCESGSHIVIKGTMETGENNQQNSQEQPSQQRDWFYQQCQVDRSNGQPTSYACQRALIEDSYYKQFAMDVQFKNIEPEFINFTHKLTTAAKVAFYSHMDENRLDVENEEDTVSVNAKYFNRLASTPIINVYVRAPRENVLFERIPTPYVRPVSALLTYVQVYKNLLKGYQGEEQCTMMEDYVRTFDNVTVPLPDSQCQYLLAKDCSSSEIFTVYARQLDLDSKTKEATIFVDGREIVLSPPSSQSSADVQIDGQVLQLQVSQARILSNGQMSVYLRETSSPNTSPIVVVDHSQHQLTIMYDGKNIQVKIGPQYKGETCGICGDDNHESDREFIGPDACLYEQAEDFVNSYAVIGSHCQQVPEMIGEKYCDRTQSTRTKSMGQQNHEQTKLSQLKNQWDLRKKSNSINRSSRFSSERMTRGQQQSQVASSHYINTATVPAAPVGSKQQQHQNQLQRIRTLAIKQNDKLCFSVQPVLACIEGISRPYQLQQQVLGFHCLPEQSISAQKLAEQSQYQVLEIVGKKQVDFATTIQVPVSCQAI